MSDLVAQQQQQDRSKESLIDLTNRIYDRHMVTGALGASDAGGSHLEFNLSEALHYSPESRVSGLQIGAFFRSSQRETDPLGAPNRSSSGPCRGTANW
jgi:hypothetical protein